MFQSYQIKSIRVSAFASAAILLGLVSCNSGNQQGPPPGAASGPQEYPVFVVESRTTKLFQEYPATIEGEQDIDIRPKIDGYIEKILVDEGSRVRKGQTLFTIRNPQYLQDLTSAEGAVSSARAELNLAELAVRKARPLVEREIISKYELESAEYTFQARKATLKQAESNLVNARVNLGYTSITSPVDGIIGDIPFRNGSYVNSNTTQPLTTVSNTGNIFVYFSMNEKQLLDVSRVLEGKTMAEKINNMPAVELVLADGTPHSSQGKVETISGKINNQTGAASFRAIFSNAEATIRSGSTGKIKIPQIFENAVIVPQKCTYELQGKRFLYTVDKNGLVHSREIQVLENSDGQFYIVKQGIAKGDHIIYEGVQTLKDKMQIKVKVLNEGQVYSDLAS